MAQLSAAVGVLRQSVADYWYQWVILLFVNMLWILACITVVLAAPATFGMFFVTNEIANGRGTSYGDFITGAKRYFRVSLIWGLINVAAAFFVWANIQFYGQIEARWSQLLLFLTLAIAVLWIFVQLFAVTYLIEQEQKRVLVAMKNALFTLLATPLFTLTMLAIIAPFIVLGVTIPVILLLGGPCFVSLLCNRAVLNRLKAFGIAKERVIDVEPLVAPLPDE